MNWEIGIDIHTLICIKWITSKNLLYKRINKIKCQKEKKERFSRTNNPISPKNQGTGKGMGAVTEETEGTSNPNVVCGSCLDSESNIQI